MERRVQQDLRWVRPVGKTLVAIGVVMAVLLVCVIGRVCVYPMTSWGEMAIANHLDEVSGGQLEIVVPAERGIRLSDVSPDGKWLLWSGYDNNNKGQRFLVNLLTGEEYNITGAKESQGHMRWLPDDQIIIHYGDDYKLIELPTMKVSQTFRVFEEEMSFEEINNLFNGIGEIFLFEGFSISNSSGALVSLRADKNIVYAYGIDAYQDLAFTPTIVPRPWNDNEYYPSPDNTLKVHIENKMLADLYVQDTAGNVVAYVKQGGRTASFLGWSPDSKAVYFKFQVGGASGGIMHPYEPVFKLVLDPALAP